MIEALSITERQGFFIFDGLDFSVVLQQEETK
jgi:hypothetical protein